MNLKESDMRIVYSKTTYRNSLYRALIAIVIGIVLVVWPNVALKSIVMFIGALFLITGIMAFITSYRRQQAEQHSDGLLSLNGIGSIVLGLLLISIPLFFTAMLMVLLGCVLILAAIAQLATLSAARQLGYISPMNYFFPVVILLAGLVVVFKPWGSAAYVVIILGVAAIFYGVTDLISQYYLRKLRKQAENEEQKKKLEDTPEIEDTDYEEIE